MNLPLQPVCRDGSGVLRFRANEVVKYILDNGGIDLNQLAVQGFDPDHEAQFASLIGYSVSGFSELDYVDDKRKEK